MVLKNHIFNQLEIAVSLVIFEIKKNVNYQSCLTKKINRMFDPGDKCFNLTDLKVYHIMSVLKY